MTYAVRVVGGGIGGNRQTMCHTGRHVSLLPTRPGDLAKINVFKPTPQNDV